MIFLIRHGETLQNAARIVQPPSSPLSPRGRAQAERLAERLAAEGVACVLASDLARARETADILCAGVKAPLELEPALQERNFGDVRGTPYAELDFDLFGPDFAPPGGETWDVFHARVDVAWRRTAALAASTRGNLAVVTHGLVCAYLVQRRLALADAGEPAPAPPARWGNTSVTVVDQTPPWRVRLVNCTAHLDAETSGDPLDPSGL